MLLLDYNEDRSLQTLSDEEEDVGLSKKTLNLDTAVDSIHGDSAKTQINTLSPYVGFGGGIYTMTVVKRMVANEHFLSMPLEDRKCLGFAAVRVSSFCVFVCLFKAYMRLSMVHQSDLVE